MSAFTELERAALRAIFCETPELSTDLERQMERATVIERRNSGVGFFTDIAVPDDAPRVRSPNVLGHNTHARVRGLEHGLGFVLFMNDGKLDMLEDTLGLVRAPSRWISPTYPSKSLMPRSHHSTERPSAVSVSPENASRLARVLPKR